MSHDDVVRPVKTSFVIAENDFRHMYIGTRKPANEKNIHRQIEPGVFVYMSGYNASNDVGYKFTIEKFVDRKLVSKLSAEYIKWDRDKKKWVVHEYNIRTIDGYTEKISQGSEKDTTLNMLPEDYQVVANVVETMTLPVLNKSISNLKLRGVNTIDYEIEKHKRRLDLQMLLSVPAKLHSARIHPLRSLIGGISQPND